MKTMKTKIKVRILCEKCRPELLKNGDWIDLRARENHYLHFPKVAEDGAILFKTKIIPLGVAMKLPDGFEAEIAPRSSTFKNWGILESNSSGKIDNSYCGNNDEWKMPVIAFKDTCIKEGDRICQFRLHLSQKATFLQKLKWLFSSGVELEFVDNLCSTDRGGFGSTGKN